MDQVSTAMLGKARRLDIALRSDALYLKKSQLHQPSTTPRASAALSPRHANHLVEVPMGHTILGSDLEKVAIMAVAWRTSTPFARELSLPGSRLRKPGRLE